MTVLIEQGHANAWGYGYTYYRALMRRARLAADLQETQSEDPNVGAGPRACPSAPQQR